MDLVINPSGVNFTNFLRGFFIQKLSAKFFALTFKVWTFLCKNGLIKCWWNWPQVPSCCRSGKYVQELGCNGVSTGCLICLESYLELGQPCRLLDVPLSGRSHCGPGQVCLLPCKSKMWFKFSYRLYNRHGKLSLLKGHLDSQFFSVHATLVVRCLFIYNFTFTRSKLEPF